MTTYYNEIDPYAAQWLRNLIAAGHIAPGDVDERSIEDVRPDDLRGYTQCHFFAGIGGWPLALRRAGWPDDRSVWSGSAPCQPFSQAGEGLGFADERHLWPYFHWLIAQRRPAEVVGEQVASKDVDPWIDLVQSDMEALGYAFGSVPFPSASVGATHIRDRNFWMAHTNNTRSQGRKRVRERIAERAVGTCGVAGRVDHAERDRRFAGRRNYAEHDGEFARAADPLHTLAHHHYGRAAPSGPGFNDVEHHIEPRGFAGGAADTDLGIGRQGCAIDGGQHTRSDALARSGLGGDGLSSERPGPTNGFWRAADWIFCRDEKWRPVEPGTFPLAYGLPAGMGKLSPELLRLASMAALDAASLKRAKSYRVGALRGYGNAINIEAAAEFIRAAREAIDQS